MNLSATAPVKRLELVWAEGGGIIRVATPVPRCPCCQALLRPDVVWFGEPLAPEAIEAAWNAVESCELLIAVGASLEVEPAASLPWRALDKGARVIEVNPAPTDLAVYCHASITASAADALPELLRMVGS